MQIISKAQHCLNKKSCHLQLKSSREHFIDEVRAIRLCKL